jgi:hypothetical protein
VLRTQHGRISGYLGTVVRRLVCAALCAVVAIAPDKAHAQDAQALFDEGLSDMKSGRYKIGCALIKKSLDIDPRPGTEFTLAECFSKAGKFASAVELYDRYLAAYDAMPADQKADSDQKARAEISRSERTRLVSLVSWLTVKLPAAAPVGVLVTKDGEPFPRGLFGVATAVDPGPHVFTARTPDGPLIEQRVDIAAGERRIVSLQVPGAAVPPDEMTPPNDTEPQPDKPEKRNPLMPWVYVTGGLGAAGLITGAITGGILLSKRKTIFTECPTKRPDGAHVCSEKGLDAADAAQNVLAPVTTVALSVGAAGAATAVVLFVIGNRSESSSSETMKRTLPVIDVGSGRAVLGLTGSF